MEEKTIILLIGAGRSGTNFLAQVLAAAPRVQNGGENRYIWNYLQLDKRFDFRPPKQASPLVRNYIRANLQSRMPDGGILLDKTPGNALRLEFALRVFPEARVVNLIRDGRASALSRVRMLDEGVKRSTGKKLNEVQRLKRDIGQFASLRRGDQMPLDRLPAFVLDTVARRVIGRMRGSVVGGERVAGLGEAAAAYGSTVARAVQWRETVMAAVCVGRRLSSSQYIEMRYEDLVRYPRNEATRLAKFLNLPVADSLAKTLSERADPDRVDAWRSELDAEQLKALEPHIRPTLEYLGYSY